VHERFEALRARILRKKASFVKVMMTLMPMYIFYHFGIFGIHSLTEVHGGFISSVPFAVSRLF
jgi:hypothetical protein